MTGVLASTNAPVALPNLVASSSARRAARRICRRHARSFFFASYFLPPAKRRHAYAVYAFCRVLDDAVDEAAGRELVPARLRKVEDVLGDIYAGRMPRVDHPETRGAMAAFAEAVSQCDIPRALFDDLVTGCRMDLEITRYDTWEHLQHYCYHVAGVVGLIMCRVFGLDDPAAGRRAVAMGNAMQLTNILRDVREDLERGRIYIPQNDLQRFEVTEADLLAGRCDDRFVALMQLEVSRARRLYRKGMTGLHFLPPDGSRLTAAVMGVVYGGILDQIEKCGYDVFSARRRLNLAQKLVRLPTAFALSQCAS